MRELGVLRRQRGAGEARTGWEGREGRREEEAGGNKGWGEEKVLAWASEPLQVNLLWAAVAGGGWGCCEVWLVACTCPHAVSRLVPPRGSGVAAELPGTFSGIRAGHRHMAFLSHLASACCLP